MRSGRVTGGSFDIGPSSCAFRHPSTTSAARRPNSRSNRRTRPDTTADEFVAVADHLDQMIANAEPQKPKLSFSC
jgi:hypothetical protein